MTTVFTTDIYERYWKKDSKGVTLKQTMFLSLILGIVIVFIVLLGFGNTITSVLDVVGNYISFFAGPSLGAFLLAMFTTRANDKGTAGGFVVGFAAGYMIAQRFDTSWLVNPAIGASITFFVGYLLSCVIKSDKAGDAVRCYTAKGLREKIIVDSGSTEDGVSVLPFSIDKYSCALLLMFLLQYVVLFLIR